MDQAELKGMPDLAVLRLLVSDGQCLVTFGRALVYRYDVDDLGMRNLAIVALTDAKQSVNSVAAVFGLTATYVSILRSRARAQGSAGLVRPMGRPSKLSARQVTQAREWSASGRSQQAIADEFGVARSVISELLARLGPAPVQQSLTPAATEVTEQVRPVSEPVLAEPETEPVEPADQLAAAFTGSARVATGSHPSRYAGGMLLYPYLHRVGTEAIFASLTGGPARRYDDLAVLSSAMLGFALGIDTVQGSKHLRRADAGAAVGLTVVPELKTFRTRLGALADGSDPLGLQRAFAAGVFSTLPGNGAAPISDMGALRDQVIGTAILVFLIFAITDARNSAPMANLTPFIVGLLVVAIGMAWGTDAGYAINPARDLGPLLASFVTGSGDAWRDQYGNLYFWVPIVGPLLGGAVGGALYKYGLQRYLPPAEAVPHA